MGEIAAAVHSVAGPHFGPVAGPGHPCWSEAVVASLRQIADDVEGCGLDAADLRKAADVAQAGAQVLNEIVQPRHLTGDPWTGNTMLAPAPMPKSCGVLDMDRTWWGDPEADWPMRMARAKQDERMAFFDAYEYSAETDGVAWRRKVYEVRHLGALRLERHRLGNQVGVEDSDRRHRRPHPAPPQHSHRLTPNRCPPTHTRTPVARDQVTNAVEVSCRPATGQDAHALVVAASRGCCQKAQDSMSHPAYSVWVTGMR
ncbi:hypothetical protein [Streptomyces sp. NPDC051211]|uniref:fructosamine kinase family protein n=1 Tax=Streptomyces sp. NPDC051211 TaxID=3154643 RepID=UPI00344DAEAE